MKRKNIIPILIALMAISLVGIVAAQVYWIKETYWLTQRQLDQEVLAIVKEAIAETTDDNTQKLIAQQIGLPEGQKGKAIEAKKDSLLQLKFLIDSMELALTEAELNKKLGISPAPPQALMAPKSVAPNLLAEDIDGDHNPTRNGYKSSNQVNPFNSTGYAGPSTIPGPKSKPGPPKRPGPPTLPGPPSVSQLAGYVQNGWVYGQPTSQYFDHQYPLTGNQGRTGQFITVQTANEQLASGSEFNYIYGNQQTPLQNRNTFTSSDLQNFGGSPSVISIEKNSEGFSISRSEISDGQVIVVPGGNRMKVKIEPYVKARVGVLQPDGQYINTYQQVEIPNLAASDLQKLNQIPGYWAKKIDSTAARYSQYYRVGKRYRAEHARYEASIARNLSNARQRNRRILGRLGRQNHDLFKYVDSLSRRQIEVAFDLARMQDSVWGLRGSTIAPELTRGLDVLTVAPSVSTACTPDQTVCEPMRSTQAAIKPVNITKAAQKKGKPGLTMEFYKTLPEVNNNTNNQVPLAGIQRVGTTLDRIIRQAEYLENPSKYIDTVTLLTNLRRAFTAHNLDVDFEYAIVNTTNDEAKAQFASVGYRSEYVANSYRASLFPDDANSGLFLSVYIPDQGSMALLNLKWSMLASIAFLLMIIGVFTAGIMTIVKQKRLSEIKSDFISNMTHELKTPLATISLASDTINNPSVLSEPSRIKYFTSIIKEENQRMNGHIERVLQMALLDKGEFRLKKCELNLVELVLEQGEHISLSVANKGGQLDVDIEEDDLPIFADKLQVQSLLTNLFDNALKYCERTPHIKLALTKEGEYAALSVEDNGIGISNRNVKRIFDRFYRVPQGDLHEVKGFGLGLSYVKAIVEAHQGFVTVDSTPGEGSKFTIRLPLINSIDNSTQSA